MSWCIVQGICLHDSHGLKQITSKVIFVSSNKWQTNINNAWLLVVISLVWWNPFREQNSLQRI